jgi:hypothetical protein
MELWPALKEKHSRPLTNKNKRSKKRKFKSSLKNRCKKRKRKRSL